MITDVASVCTAEIFRDVSHVSVQRASQQQARRAAQPMLASLAGSQRGRSVVADGLAGSQTGAISGQSNGHEAVLLFGGTLSPADLAYLDELLDAYGLGGTIAAGLDSEPGDISDRSNAAARGRAAANPDDYACKLQLAAAVAERLGLKCHRLPMPIGIARTDEFLRTLQKLGRLPAKPRHGTERDRLAVRLASGNERLANRRVVVYGEEMDFVVGMVSLTLEAGMLPILCASQADSQQLRTALENLTPELHARTSVVQVERFADLESAIVGMNPQLLIGNRDACSFARHTRIPFVCAGRPLCDRNGGTPVLHIGYRGASQLLDRLEVALGEYR